MPLFMEAAKSEETDSFEYRLEHTEIYNQYLKIFEKKVTDHIEGLGASLDDFIAQCKETLERGDPYDSRSFFIEALLATTGQVAWMTSISMSPVIVADALDWLAEFDVFFNMMVGEAR
jgi:hypothetical protein